LSKLLASFISGRMQQAGVLRQRNREAGLATVIYDRITQMILQRKARIGLHGALSIWQC